MPKLAAHLLLLLAFLVPFPRSAHAAPPSPQEVLGRPVGTDFKLADWEQISGYIDQLGSQSPRVRVEKVGKTTEGRDFRIAIISSEKNLADLDRLKAQAKRIADPRGLSPGERKQLLETAKAFIFISNNMHSTEIASAEMSLQLAYTLATSEDEPWKSARDEVVVVIAPSTNPDGQDRVVKWYRQIVGTPYESARLPELYQWYAGHDNNRDWFMASLKETQIVTRLLYTEWFPQVYWDVHQQGSRSDRLFFPPFRDPLNPNLDPSIMTGIGALGSRVVADMTRSGLQGVSTGVKYDMWWNGGNRNVPVRHNIMGFLSEAASANLASPIFLEPRRVSSPRGLPADNVPSNHMPNPWPGGWWRIGDIVRYELAVAESLIGSVARERRYWLGLSLEAAERAIEAGIKEAPHAWLIPPANPDRGAARRLLRTLLLEGIEIGRAKEAFKADGVEYPAGTLVLPRAQPYGRFLKDLFEIQRYPSDMEPYDVTGWTLPLIMGVRRVRIEQPFSVSTEPVTSADQAVETLGPDTEEEDPYPWPHLRGDDSDGLRGAIALLSEGVSLRYDGHGDSSRPGAWIVPRGQIGKARRVLKKLDLEVVPGRPGAKRADARRGQRSAEAVMEIEELPRVGLYAPWAASMNEGWTRWTFDELGLPYERLRNETVRAGGLRDRFDVIVLPSVSARVLHEGRPEGSVFPRYAGGLDPEGTMALHDFVQRGGTLIAVERSTDYVREVFDLPLQDAANDEAFRCPGSILKTVPNGHNAWSVGLPPTQPVYFSRSRAFVPEAMSKPAGDQAPVSAVPPVGAPEVLLQYPASRILLSGFLQGETAIAGAAAWVRVPVGMGQIHLFAIRPTYRSWTHSNFRMLVRAILLPPPPPQPAEAGTKDKGGRKRRRAAG